MSRGDSLREEYLEHQAFLRDNPAPDHPAAQLVNAQLSHRLAEIDEELVAHAQPHLDLRLTGESTDRHAIPADLLTAVVGRLQKAVTWTVWAFKAGPGVAGTPPASVERSAAADVFAMAPGSFRLGFRRHAPELDIQQEHLGIEEGLFAQSLDAFVAITDAAQTASFESVEDTVQLIGRGASRRVQLLFSTLAKSQTTVEFAWHDESVRRTVVSPDAAESLVQWLSEYDEARQVIPVTGVLTILDTERGRFGLRDAADQLFEGKAPSDLLSGATAGSTYDAEIEIAKRTGQHTGAEHETMVLRSLARSGPQRLAKVPREALRRARPLPSPDDSE